MRIEDSSRKCQENISELATTYANVGRKDIATRQGRAVILRRENCYTIHSAYKLSNKCNKEQVQWQLLIKIKV